MAQPVRVLEVFDGMDCGGAENMIMNLYRNIDRSIVQLDFLVHTEKKCFFDDEIIELGGHIYRVPYFNVKNYKDYKGALDKIFSDHPEITVVHGHLGSCANIYLDAAKKHGCFTIAHSHNTKPEFSLKNVIYRLNTFQVRRIADYFIGCSEAAGRYRFGNNIVDKSGRYANLNNAIHTNKFVFNPQTREKIREQYGLKEEIVLGHVGRFNYQKNHDYLIDIFNEFVKQYPTAKLMLIGDGELRGEIQEKVTSLALTGNVIFTGLQRNVNELLQGIDCFVFPSHYEGLPVTVIEAQASGLPCAISDHITKEVSVTDLVEYVPIDGDVKPWVDTIEKLINNNQRQNRKEDIVKAGYDIDATTDWILNLYVSNARRNQNG